MCRIGKCIKLLKGKMLHSKNLMLKKGTHGGIQKSKGDGLAVVWNLGGGGGHCYVSENAQLLCLSRSLSKDAL